MILRNTKDTPMMKLLRGMLPVVLSAIISVTGALVTIRVQLSELVSAVAANQKYNEKISLTLDSVKAKQDSLFELYYVPRRDEWQNIIMTLQKNTASIVDLERTDQIIREDMHRYHPNAYSGGPRGRY